MEIPAHYTQHPCSGYDMLYQQANKSFWDSLFTIFDDLQLEQTSKTLLLMHKDDFKTKLDECIELHGAPPAAQVGSIHDLRFQEIYSEWKENMEKVMQRPEDQEPTIETDPLSDVEIDPSAGWAAPSNTTTTIPTNSTMTEPYLDTECFKVSLADLFHWTVVTGVSAAIAHQGYKAYQKAETTIDKVKAVALPVLSIALLAGGAHMVKHTDILSYL